MVTYSGSSLPLFLSLYYLDNLADARLKATTGDRFHLNIRQVSLPNWGAQLPAGQWWCRQKATAHHLLLPENNMERGITIKCHRWELLNTNCHVPAERLWIVLEVAQREGEHSHNSWMAHKPRDLLLSPKTSLLQAYSPVTLSQMHITCTVSVWKLSWK